MQRTNDSIELLDKLKSAHVAINTVSDEELKKVLRSFRGDESTDQANSAGGGGGTYSKDFGCY